MLSVSFPIQYFNTTVKTLRFPIQCFRHVSLVHVRQLLIWLDIVVSGLVKKWGLGCREARR